MARQRATATTKLCHIFPPPAGTPVTKQTLADHRRAVGYCAGAKVERAPEVRVMNSFNSLAELRIHGEVFHFYSLPGLERQGVGSISRLPYCLKILLEKPGTE